MIGIGLPELIIIFVPAMLIAGAIVFGVITYLSEKRRAENRLSSPQAYQRQPVATPRPRFCTKCGQQVAHEDAFCIKCGTMQPQA